MEQIFIIAQRNLEDEIHIETEKDLTTAIAKQKALLVGAPVEMVRPLINEKEINEVLANLNRMGRDRLCNDEEEVYLFFLPKRNVMR